MRYRISEAEMDIMKILWERGPCRASEIACACKDRNGWEKNTSYTFLQRLVQKKAVRRRIYKKRLTYCFFMIYN